MKFDLKVFGLGLSAELAARVAQNLEIPLESFDEEVFPDGEMSLRYSGSVHESHCIVFQSLAESDVMSPSENLFQLLLAVQLLKDVGVSEVTAVTPYLCYSRADERKEPGDPLTLRYMAHLLVSSGVNRLVTLDVHNPAAFENAFQCETLNLECGSLFHSHLRSEIPGPEKVVVLSPDFGGIKRAERFRQGLQNSFRQPVEFAYLEKYRNRQGLKGQALVGQVQNSCVVIFDDMISTGQTILRAAEECKKQGARRIFVVATHGIFSQQPETLMHSEWIDQVLVTDSNPNILRPDYPLYPKLRIFSCATVLSQGLESLLRLDDLQMNRQSFVISNSYI